MSKETLLFGSYSTASLARDVEYLADGRNWRSEIWDGVIYDPDAQDGGGLNLSNLPFWTDRDWSNQKLLNSVTRFSNLSKSQASYLPKRLGLRVGFRFPSIAGLNYWSASSAPHREEAIRRFKQLGAYMKAIQQVTGRKLVFIWDMETYNATNMSLTTEERAAADVFRSTQVDANAARIREFFYEIGLAFGVNCPWITSLGYLYKKTRTGDTALRYEFLPAALDGLMDAALAVGTTFIDYIQQAYNEKTELGHAYYRTHPTQGYASANFDDISEGSWRLLKYGRSIFPQSGTWTAAEYASGLLGGLAEAQDCTFLVAYIQEYNVITGASSIGTAQSDAILNARRALAFEGKPEETCD